MGKIEKAPNGDKLHQGLFDDNTMILSSVDMKVNKQSEALEVIEQWLHTDFPPVARHQRRVAKIDNLVPEAEHEF